MDIGLTSFLGAPVDLRQLKIEFMAEDEISADSMIIHLSGFSYEICPKYPDIGEISRLWETLAGEYDLVPRLPSGMPGTRTLGQTRIWVADGVLADGRFRRADLAYQ